MKGTGSTQVTPPRTGCMDLGGISRCLRAQTFERCDVRHWKGICGISGGGGGFDIRLGVSAYTPGVATVTRPSVRLRVVAFFAIVPDRLPVYRPFRYRQLGRVAGDSTAFEIC